MPSGPGTAKEPSGRTIFAFASARVTSGGWLVVSRDSTEPSVGRDRFWPIPFWPIHFWPVHFWICVCVCHGGAQRVGPRRVGGPKFRAFFPSPATIFFHSSLSWGSSRGILVLFEALGPSNVHVLELLGCGVKAPAAPNPQGFHTRAQTCTFGGPRLQEQQNSTRTHPERQKKRKWCGRGKKERIFCGPAEGVRRRVGRGSKPTTHNTTQQHTTTPLTLTNTNTTTTHTNTNHNTTQHDKNGLAQIGWSNGLAKIGLAKIGLAKVGHYSLCLAAS